MNKLIFSILLLFLISCGNDIEVVKKEHDKKDLKLDFHLPKLPKSITFCDKEYNLDNFDVKERLDKEIIVNTYYHSSTIQCFKRANRFFSELEILLKENNVPDDMKYLCLIESGLLQAVSPSGAKGFWQFMPNTGKEYGLVINKEIDERLHIEKSTIAACQYLNDANQNFNDWMLSSASYNRGVAGIERDLSSQNVSNYFDLHLNNETSRYVFRILALKIIFENPEAYGFNIDDIELYDPIKTRTIEVDYTIKNMKIWAKEQNSNYHMLKVLNPWLISTKLTYNGTNHQIQLPI